MNLVEIARNNVNSWNRHDAEAIAAAYAEEGVTFGLDIQSHFSVVRRVPFTQNPPIKTRSKNRRQCVFRLVSLDSRV
jgi:hypothetical protein